ncbi:hypothetical protein V757_02290 [Pelistega indica]|uniref:Uncharacterized protein n=1 Tax=Pelistega indica TaxID=1414851 RepID=V8GA10_9BURK|nr:hypothetical protein [Pelistega indica]ETD72788.1 hypothetical protein V757_02290 [Pelistega indica]
MKDTPEYNAKCQQILYDIIYPIALEAYKEGWSTVKIHSHMMEALANEDIEESEKEAMVASAAEAVSEVDAIMPVVKTLDDRLSSLVGEPDDTSDDTPKDKEDIPVDTGSFMPCFAIAPHNDGLVRAYVDVDTIIGVEEGELFDEQLTAIATVSMAHYFTKLDLEETLALIKQYAN